MSFDERSYYRRKGPAAGWGDLIDGAPVTCFIRGIFIGAGRLRECNYLDGACCWYILHNEPVVNGGHPHDCDTRGFRCSYALRRCLSFGHPEFAFSKKCNEQGVAALTLLTPVCPFGKESLT